MAWASTVARPGLCRRRNAGSSDLAEVGREDRETAVGLYSLEELADLDVCLAVVAVLHLGPLAHQRVCLVEEEDCAAFLGRVEDGATRPMLSKRATDDDETNSNPRVSLPCRLLRVCRDHGQHCRRP
jgi:hypothetical protein